MVTCDRCGNADYTEANPFVEFRMGNRTQMYCVLVGHKRCLHPEPLPRIGNGGGTATPDQWNAWIESPAARAAGFLILS